MFSMIWSKHADGHFPVKNEDAPFPLSPNAAKFAKRMHGSPRRKGTEYLQFRPYRAIVAPQLSKQRKEAALSDALKSALVLVILVGIPVLLAVPIVTYFTSDFANLQQFAAHAGRNLLLPVVAVFGIGILGGVLSIIRR
jgi:hypothetical protein